ncbi:MAG: hypothetical protein M1820_010074 [Bogoriella megaspora]|nr:MAG: hypothetical protein M1820_010074 [Bogoriella megaspora]
MADSHAVDAAREAFNASIPHGLDTSPSTAFENTDEIDPNSPNSGFDSMTEGAENTMYTDTHRLDTLSQAADMATASFSRTAVDQMPSNLDAFAGGPMTPSTSNWAQDTLYNNPSPATAMEMDFLWDQAWNISEWTTFDPGFPDSFSLPMIGFDTLQYSTPDSLQTMPVFGQGAVMPQNDGSGIRTSETRTLPEKLPYLDVGSDDPQQIAERQSGAIRQQEDLQLRSSKPSATHGQGALSHSSGGISMNNLALDDARQEQMMKRAGPWPTDWNPRKPDNLLGFPDMSSIRDDFFEAEIFGHVEPLEKQVYDDIVRCLKTISKEQHFFRKFRNADLPSLAAFDSFIQLYFEFFHPTYPMLHQPTFNPSRTHHALILAITSIGCRYSKFREAKRCAVPLSELARRAILQTVEADNSTVREVWLTQAWLLNNFSMMYSGDKRLIEVAQAHWGSLVVVCRGNGSLQATSRSITVDPSLSGERLESKWKQWKEEESRTRVGFLAWGFDSQMPMHFDLPPSMDMGELQRKLPIREDVWDASNAETWKILYLKYQGQTPDLPTTLRNLKNGHELPEAVGDLARIMLVQAIHSTAWGLRRTFKNTLIDHLSPLNDAQCRLTLQQQWMSILEEIAKNSVVTDDQASIAATVRVHMHHVALLLYAPLTELLAFARSQVNSSTRQDAVHQKLLVWVQDDHGRTARRAVVHASVIFGLIRASSHSSFYEPFSVIISTLTIWAYIQLAPSNASTSAAIGRAGPPASIGSNRQQTIRLDKIKTQDVVQAWVEFGAELRGHITDVGNITGPGAGQRLLHVACRTLKGLESWALSNGFARVLAILGGGREGSVSRQMGKTSNIPFES